MAYNILVENTVVANLGSDITIQTTSIVLEFDDEFKADRAYNSLIDARNINNHPIKGYRIPIKLY